MDSIAVVAHDAGATNHIYSWLKTGYINVNNIAIYAEGPAVKIFRDINPKFRSNSLEEALDNTSLLLSGTGGVSSLEHKSRTLARKKKIKSIAVIDHWVNYRERFSRDGKEVLPDEIWVTDEYAIKLAKKILPEVNVYLHRNDYLSLQLKEIKKFSTNKNKNVTRNVLFVMEPIYQTWGNLGLPGEIQSFEYFVKNKELCGIGDDAKIIIKPHPADKDGKYDFCISKYNNLSLRVESSLSLAELIAWSDIVVGCHTYAMVVALEAGKKVISATPPYTPKYMLPQPGITYISRLNGF